MSKQGVSVEEIAKTLKRTEIAIRFKLRYADGDLGQKVCQCILGNRNPSDSIFRTPRSLLSHRGWTLEAAARILIV